MEYLVPLGILVAVAAWLIAAFTRLYHLHGIVEHAWMQWSKATQQRNECLLEFIILFSGHLPRGDLRPRNLRRLTDDSRRTLRDYPDIPPHEEMRHLSRAERSLRQVVVNAVQMMENSGPMRQDTELNELSNRVSLSLFEQDEITRFFNRCVGDFNTALSAPGSRLVAGLFGFVPIEEIR